MRPIHVYVSQIRTYYPPPPPSTSRSQESLKEPSPSTPSDNNTLPTYQEALEEDTPPSYETLYGRYRAAVERKTKCFLIAFFIGLIVVAGIIILITIVIPACMISYGSKNIEKCPLQPAIPIALVVGGVLDLVWVLSLTCSFLSGTDEYQPLSHLNYAFFAIFLCWLGPSMVWTYGAYSRWDSKNELSLAYCDRPVYSLAFTVVSIGSCASLFGLIWIATHCCKRWTFK